MQTLWQDVRHSWRLLAKSPSFTCVAVLTLAFGIGANTAIFSIINAVLLKPLAFHEPDNLMVVWNTDPQDDQFAITYPDFLDWRQQQQSFEQLGAYSSRDFTLTGTGDPVRLRAAMLTAEVLPLLGVPPQLGRFFEEAEDRPGARAVILSHRLWRERFSARTDLLGQTITLNGTPHNVVGVMPADFAFPLQNDPPIELWTTTATLQEGRLPLSAQRGNHAMEAIGRLKANVTRQQAQTDMQNIVAGLAAQYPETNAEFGVRVAPLHQELVRDVRTALWILFGAVACVLLIACANVANLLLVRASSRHKEMAIRSALGAGRLRIIRQLLTESLLLALIGGGLGILLAMWATDSLVALAPKGLPRAAEVALDGRVLGFTALIALFTGALFGLAPALQISKTRLMQTLKESGRTSTEGNRHHRLRSALVVAEVAIALMLLVTAGLLINSFYRLQQVQPGFHTAKLLSFRLSLPETRYAESQAITNFYRQLDEGIETIPGVQSVAYTTALPFSGQGGGLGFSIEGEPTEANVPFPYETDYRTISPGYFQTLGIPLLSGRDYDQRDTNESNPVVIINETLAKKYFANQNPLGKRINPSFGADSRGVLMREIIGIVGDVKHARLDEEANPVVYIAHAQNSRPVMTMAVLTENDPNQSVAAIRAQVQAIDKDLPIFNLRTVEQAIRSSVAQPRFNTLLLGLFAGVALLLTIVGLYGVMSYSVTLRTHEIGLRMALGAQPSEILRLVLKQGLRLTLLGVLLGLAIAYAIARVTESLLFDISATDPLTFSLVSALLIGVALAACFIPARRATKVDPMVALRYE